MQVGRIEYAPNYRRVMASKAYTEPHHPDSIARRHVEHELATEIFGPIHMYGIHEPVAVGVIRGSQKAYNDNVPVAKQPARIADDLKRPLWAIAPQSALPNAGISAQVVDGVKRMVIQADKFHIGVKPPAEWFPSDRRGDFMQTFTGRKFWPLDSRAEDVDIRDIAHSLSLQCRYAGHCSRFYSVAEHSILMARWLLAKGDASAALYALLHDAAEAYTVDVPRPLKRHLVGYKEAEASVMAAICDAFGIDRSFPPIVHEADTRIIADELVNLRWMPWHDKHDDPLGVTLEYWTPERAEIEFLALYLELAGEEGRAAA